MQLLARLIERRDYYLALAGRFSELVTFVESDPILGSSSHRAKQKIMNGARAKYDGLTAPRAALDALTLGLMAGTPRTRRALAKGARARELELELEVDTIRAPAAKPKRKLSKAQRAAMSKRMSRQMRKLWRDPVMRKKLLKATKRGGRRKSSSPAPTPAAHDVATVEA
jgi:hypothetical protein